MNELGAVLIEKSLCQVKKASISRVTIFLGLTFKNSQNAKNHPLGINRDLLSETKAILAQFLE